MKRLGLLAVFVVACGGGDSSETPDGPGPSDGPESDGPDPDGPAGVFAITSPLYNDGGTIPSEITCDGANTSPQLDWESPPANTMSYAIVFTDLTNGLIHSVIYDIPANLTGLPADVDKVFEPPDVSGAKQTRAFNNNFGYAGPCPPNTHTYEFKLYAMSVATLPGGGMNLTRALAKTAIEDNDIEAVTLTGMYTPQ